MLLKFIPPRIFSYKPLPKMLFSSLEAITKADQIKKHQELNKKFKDYREIPKFVIQNPNEKTNQFITDSHKEKQSKEMKTFFDDFFEKSMDNFDEKQFIVLITKISQMFEIEKILKDPKFEIMIKKIALKITGFRDTRNACFFICFCSINNLNYPEIWDYFTSYLLNMKEQMTVESKCMILLNYMPINAKRSLLFYSY